MLAISQANKPSLIFLLETMSIIVGAAAAAKHMHAQTQTQSSNGSSISHRHHCHHRLTIHHDDVGHVAQLETYIY
jgi:hypothetical protein